MGVRLSAALNNETVLSEDETNVDIDEQIGNLDTSFG